MSSKTLLDDLQNLTARFIEAGEESGDRHCLAIGAMLSAVCGAAIAGQTHLLFQHGEAFALSGLEDIRRQRHG